MNAVNLMPAGTRRALRSSRTRPTVSVSRPFIGLVVGLVLVLLGTVLYVSAHNKVSSRRAELTQIQASAAEWSAAAGNVGATVEKLSARATSVDHVRALVADRYHWSVLLAQIAGRLPARAALTALSATAPLAAHPLPSDGIQITGCAAAQSDVAETMDSLRAVTGVSNVTLSSSTKSAAATTGPGCHLPITFQIALFFGSGASASSSTAAAAATSTGLAQ